MHICTLWAAAEFCLLKLVIIVASRWVSAVANSYCKQPIGSYVKFQIKILNGGVRTGRCNLLRESEIFACPPPTLSKLTGDLMHWWISGRSGSRGLSTGDIPESTIFLIFKL